MLQFAEALYGLYATEQDGQGLVEYALLVALIALAAVAAVGLAGGKVKEIFNEIAGKIKVPAA